MNVDGAERRKRQPSKIPSCSDPATLAKAKRRSWLRVLLFLAGVVALIWYATDAADPYAQAYSAEEQAAWVIRLFSFACFGLFSQLV